MASTNVSDSSSPTLTGVNLHSRTPVSGRAVLHQQVENAEALPPVLGCRVLQIVINDFEGARERHAQPARDHRQSTLGLFAISEVQRRPCGELIENRPQFNLLVAL